jgi:rubrerythrin
VTLESLLADAVRTPEGRAYLLSYVGEEETASIPMLTQIASELVDPQLQKMAAKHLADEMRHETVLRERFLAMGLPPPKVDANAVLAELYREMNPQTTAEKYMVVQVLEERAARTYPLIAKAFRPYDPASADVFEGIAADEARHVRFCEAVTRRIGHVDSDETLARYRRAESRLQRIEEPVVVYEHSRHFEMMQSWAGEKLNPEGFGSGLVIPGQCCGFVDGIGTTRTAFFYGLRANPQMPLVARGKAILRLADRVISAARNAGYTSGVTSTSNDVVAKFWVSRMGFC